MLIKKGGLWLQNSEIERVYAFSTSLNNYIATSISLSGANKFAFSGWFCKPVAASNVMITASTSNTNTVALSFAANGIIYWQINNTTNALGTCTITDNKWHEFYATYDGTATGNSNRLKLYIDGVLTTLTFTGTIPAAVAAVGNISIGRNTINTTTYSELAVLQNIKIYVGTVPTLQQARDMSPVGLQCIFPLNEGSGNKIYCAKSGAALTATHDSWKIKP